jgi:hypothetical protein
MAIDREAKRVTGRTEPGRQWTKEAAPLDTHDRNRKTL